MQRCGQRVKVAKINVNYQLNMKSKSKVEYIREGKIVIPIFLEDDNDHVRDLQHPRHVRRHPGCPVPVLVWPNNWYRHGLR